MTRRMSRAKRKHLIRVVVEWLARHPLRPLTRGAVREMAARLGSSFDIRAQPAALIAYACTLPRGGARA